MLNAALFAKVKLNFEDRIIVISASLGFNIVPDFRFTGSNFIKIFLVSFCRHKAFAASYWICSKSKLAARKDKVLTQDPMEYLTSAAETESFLNFFAVSSLQVN
jgi:hypothetical protein